jgi:hypothetical protein
MSSRTAWATYPASKKKKLSRVCCYFVFQKMVTSDSSGLQHPLSGKACLGPGASSRSSRPAPSNTLQQPTPFVLHCYELGHIGLLGVGKMHCQSPRCHCF